MAHRNMTNWVDTRTANVWRKHRLDVAQSILIEYRSLTFGVADTTRTVSDRNIFQKIEPADFRESAMKQGAFRQPGQDRK
jgi:hypothetical protein